MFKFEKEGRMIHSDLSEALKPFVYDVRAKAPLLVLFSFCYEDFRAYAPKYHNSRTINVIKLGI